MKAIITAGGKGTRMRPLTFSTNKHLIPLANKPLLHYAIEAVVAAGIKQVGVNYNPGQLEELKSALGDGSRWGVKLAYILQEEPLGLANIIQVSQSFLGKGKFLMHLGDNIFYGGIKALVDYFANQALNGLITMVHHPENFRMGVPFFDRRGRLIKYVEKPLKPPHDWGVPGLYFADENIFKCFTGNGKIRPSARGEYEIPSAFQWLMDHRYRVEAKEFIGVWRDPGKFDDWLETNRFLLDHELKEAPGDRLIPGVRVEGRIKIGRGCLFKDAVVRGPAIIGDQVTIKNSFIGPYSSIGSGCEIINSRIENSILAREVRVIDVDKPLDGSLVGEKTVISKNGSVGGSLELFVGNQCEVKL